MIQIVVLNRGWVAVGEVTEKGKKVIVNKASIIRVWGTKNGLGEIAKNGPTSETVLDPCPKITAHELTVVFCMDADQSKWKKYVQ